MKLLGSLMVFALLCLPLVSTSAQTNEAEQNALAGRETVIVTGTSFMGDGDSLSDVRDRARQMALLDAAARGLTKVSKAAAMEDFELKRIVARVASAGVVRQLEILSEGMDPFPRYKVEMKVEIILNADGAEADIASILKSLDTPSPSSAAPQQANPSQSSADATAPTNRPLQPMKLSQAKTAPDAPQAAPQNIQRRIARRVPLKQQPDKSSKSLDILAPGEKVTVIATVQDTAYAKVRMVTGIEGYLRMDRLDGPPLLIGRPSHVDISVSPLGPDSATPGDVIRDCNFCPPLRVIPAGTGVVGAADDEDSAYDDEKPRRSITMKNALAVGAYEITFHEWDACVADGGCGGYVPHNVGEGRANKPVINVSWKDAQSYVSWLSDRTGRAYRLLSSDEWEYAARAGSTTAYPWGTAASDLSCRFANINGKDADQSAAKSFGLMRFPCYDTALNTAAIGSYEHNSFGLYDMIGNVWEWVSTCRRSDPSDHCTHQEIRGASWRTGPRLARTAARDAARLEARQDDIGFRVARDLIY